MLGDVVSQSEQLLLKQRAILSREAILALLRSEPPLIEGLRSIEEQVQPSGVDLTVRSILRFRNQGRIGRDSRDRHLPDTEELPFDKSGYLDLPPGAYQVLYNEVVNIPRSLVAIGLPRSSLLRSGVSIHTALWDAGYSGRSVSLLVVYNHHGFRLQKDARLLQLVFVALSHITERGYSGVYKNENL